MPGHGVTCSNMHLVKHQRYGNYWTCVTAMASNVKATFNRTLRAPEIAVKAERFVNIFEVLYIKYI